MAINIVKTQKIIDDVPRDPTFDVMVGEGDTQYLFNVSLKDIKEIAQKINELNLK